MQKMKRVSVAKLVGQVSALAAVVLFGAVEAASAQDTRTVVEPVFPTACTVLQAQQAIVTGEPASETVLDTARLQTALSAAATTCVELTANGANNAFLIAPITIPANVTLLIDGGVTVFGSRNPADYQVGTAGVETCGTVGTAGNGCNPLVSSTGANSGIMGFGVLDGRGQDKLLVAGAPVSYSWWDNAGNAQNNGGSQNNPILVMANGANFTLYKITVRNSPMFHVKWSGNSTTRTGFTAWGVKVITPFTARNSDGIDPSGGNITITNSSISDGDDMVAVSASSASGNITVQNTNTYSGHGISIGSYTAGGLTNMLVQNITQMGTAADGNGGGLRIKTSQDRGGLVQNVTYQNICSANIKSPIYLSPYYNTNSGTSYPTFSNITYRNVHVITEGTITLTGYANTGATVTRPATLNFDNFIVDTLKQTDFSPTPAYLTITQGPGPVSPLLLSQTGTGVTYMGGVTNPTQAPYACSASTFQYLVGELYGSTSSATNLNTATITTNGTVTLNAMLQPAMSQVSYASISGQGSYTGTAAPVAAVQFREGTNVVGTANVAGNGTIASVTLSGLTAGTHTYTAYYAGDSTYTLPLSFGSVAVTVGQAAATTTTLTPSAASATYGTATVLTAAVTGTASGTPSGQVVFTDSNSTPSSSVPLASVSVTGGSAQSTQVLGAGSHSLQAVYSGDSSFAASTSASVAVSIGKASPAIALASPAAAMAYGGSTTLTATVLPGGAGSYPTGTVIFYEGTAIVGSGALNGSATASATVMPTGGTHAYTATYQGDVNYVSVSSTAVAVSVTPVSTTTTLTVSGPTAYGSTTVLSATVAPGITGLAASPTGSVTFYSGTSIIGSGTVSGSAVSASAVLPSGSNTLTAKYSGDGNFAASTGTVASLSVGNPFSLAPTPATLSLAAGGTGSVTLAITPSGGFTGNVALTCASPVSYISCVVSPSSQTLTGTSPMAATLTVQVAATLARTDVPAGVGESPRFAWAMLLPFSLLALPGNRKALRTLLLCCLLFPLLIGASGCAGSPSSSLSNVPPAGTQAVTVTATSGVASASTTVNVTITH